MASYKCKFMTVIMLISVLILCFQQPIRATMTEYENCINAFKIFCNDDDFVSMDLKKCAKRAIMQWTTGSVDQKYIYDYFWKLENHLEPGPGMQDVDEFCKNREEHCKTDLKIFQWTNNTLINSAKKNILMYAYQIAYFNTKHEPGNYTIDYLRHISDNFQFTEGIADNALKPELYCDNWYPYLNVDLNTGR